MENSINRDFRNQSSFYLTDAKSERQDDQGRGFWKNRLQQLFFFFGYCVDLRTLGSLIFEDSTLNPKTVPSFIQIIFVAIIIAGPIIFIQVFIGQFTQKGCIAIGSMLPATYGFGYSMLVIGLLDVVVTLYFSGPGLHYVGASLLNFPYPAWMYCTDKMYEKYPNCFSREDMDACQSCHTNSNNQTKSCFDPKENILSALVFKYMIAFEKDLTIKELKNIGLPQIKSLSHVFFTVVLVYFASCRRLLDLDWALRLCLIFSVLGITVSLAVVIANASAVSTMRNMFETGILPLTDLRCWEAAVRRVTDIFKLSTGGHVYMGSHLRRDAASHFRVTYLMSYLLLFVTLYYAQYYLIEALMLCRLNADSIGLQSASDVIFVLYATEFGLTAAPQIWSTLHFSIYWILSVMSMTMQIILIDETLSEELKITKYYKYTRFGFCVIIFILTLPLLTPGGRLLATILEHEMKIINLLIISLTFVILFLYNIQRLNDDIHFVLNAPPTWYIQTCWIVSAIVCAVTFFFQIFHYVTDNKYYFVRLSIYSLIGSPILIGFIAKLVEYFKKRNITGMFRPSLYYGAPDLNSRMLRLLYNPRLEVRYKRRRESCKHRCLLDNIIMVKAVENEISLLEQVIFDLKHNEVFKGENSDVIAQLEEHSTIIKKRYSKLIGQFDYTHNYSSL